MPRLLSEVPAYLFTALSGMGLLLFANFLYVLFTDSQYVVIAVGGALISAALLLGRFLNKRASRNADAAAAGQGKQAFDTRFLQLMAQLGVAMAIAIPPMLGIRWYNTEHLNPRLKVLTGTIVTRIGEHRCEGLPDGSQVCVNTNTRVHYAFNRNIRHFEVVSGEASFTVKADADRPLEVSSGQTLVHDISTGFSIRKRTDSTQVTVIEGRVRVVAPMSPELKARVDRGEADNAWKTAPEFRTGQQLEFDEATQTLIRGADLSAEELSRRLAWKTGRIYLRGYTIGSALEELSRYQSAMKFEFSDPTVALIRVDGNVRSDDLDSFLQVLAFQYHIHSKVTPTGDGTLIRLSRRK